MKNSVYRMNMYLGIAILAGSTFLLTLNNPFMKTWYYIFAWWPFILILDSLNFRRTGASPLSDSRKDFLYMAFISVFVWLIFELINLRLQNWEYVQLPADRFQRWTGYFLAFATVIPAIQELTLLYAGWLGKSQKRFFRLPLSPVWLRTYFFMGVLGLALTLVWPKLFFPLVWLGFLFLLDPVNHALGEESLFRDLHRNDWTRFWSLGLAGLTAGIVWELLNFWSGSHWEYHLPYFEFGKIFQMPVLGYFGFVPFAMEVFVLFTLLQFIRSRIPSRKYMILLLLILLLLFYAGVFSLMDTHSLGSDLEGLQMTDIYLR